ncbi:hypothetical protein [Marinobacterium sediminicola]|nr:hypothetical protein [Marinobacterium sediminicola]ULG68745.1 hypothetical protein LN244_13760 [Marinobacterium sediminicola]
MHLDLLLVDPCQCHLLACLKRSWADQLHLLAFDPELNKVHDRLAGLML